MIRQKIKLDSKKKPEVKTGEYRERLKSLFHKSKPAIIIVIGLLILLGVFRDGMLYQIYRNSEPQTRNEDISIKEKVEAIKTIRETQYLTGTIIRIDSKSLTLATAEDIEYEINADDSILILGTKGKPIRYKDLQTGIKVTITTEGTGENLQAKRIKLEE